MTQNRSPKQLAKLVAYLLERRPDEFGLVANADGYFRVKEVLKAITEEEGWKYVRRSDLDEILLTMPSPPFEISDPFIRGIHRGQLPPSLVVDALPKLLYLCMRRKAHPFAMEKGVFPSAHPQIVLSSDRELALRIGKRIDSHPVLLSVHVDKSLKEGVVYRQVGQSLFVTDFLPASCLMGPALPKEKPEAAKPPPLAQAEAPRLSGSFFLDLNSEPGARAKAKDHLSSRQAVRKKKGKKKGEKWVREAPPWRR
jgi:putative RNA 2'-phosphotransferase